MSKELINSFYDTVIIAAIAKSAIPLSVREHIQNPNRHNFAVVVAVLNKMVSHLVLVLFFIGLLIIIYVTNKRNTKLYFL